jgi:NAD(P)-dependent dehydrogenase (short-subunit alcohol dehydrogenase family)
MTLRDRVVLVTGASAGIGAATARALAERGCRVVLMARRPDRLAEVAESIRAGGGHAHPVVGDVTRDADVAQAIQQAISVFGALDVLVCNAGIGHHGTVESTSPEEMARLIDVNFMGTFLAIRAALPHLRQRPEARIVIVSSIVGKRGIGFGGPYSATKFAQVGLAEALRAELAGTSVKVSVVLPVSTETEFREVMAQHQGYAIQGHGPRQPAERVAKAIVRAVEHPRAEVYPYGPSRLLSIANAMAPSLTDRLIRRFGRKPVPPAPAAAHD